MGHGSSMENPADPLTIFEFQDQEIGEFYRVQEQFV